MKRGKQLFDVYGYKTKDDFETRDYEIISEYETKASAIRTAEREIERGNWYAIKYQSEDREEIEIIYS